MSGYPFGNLYAYFLKNKSSESIMWLVFLLEQVLQELEIQVLPFLQV
jgi:hypothetical protein